MDSLPLRYERLSCLHQGRALVRRGIETCRDATSPIRRIPNEVLGEIFVHCLPPDHRFSFTAAPLLLLQVNWLWHDVAVSKPCLWSQVAFWTPISRIDRMCYPLRFLHTWLLRSGIDALELFFDQGLVYHHLKPLVELGLLSHSHRCRHLDIRVTGESAPALVEFIMLPPGSLANLETLVLEGIDEADFAFEGQGVTVFRNSRRLRKLTTSNLNYVFNFDITAHGISLELDLLFLPWAQLTHLMITDFIRVEIFAITLQECTSLQFLRVSLNLENEADPLDMDRLLPAEPVILPSLTDFHISISDGASIPSFMDIFTYPRLQRLHLRRLESSQQFLDESQPRFWTKSPQFCLQLGSLTYLSLVGSIGTAEEIIVLLESTPQVADLVLNIWTNYQRLVPKLFPPLNIHFPELSPPRPLRRLAHFSVHLNRHDFPFPFHLIRNAADTAHFTSLKCLTVMSELSCEEELQDVSHQFCGSRLQTVFVIPCWSAGRCDTDADLIDHEHTSRNYTIFDHIL